MGGSLPVRGMRVSSEPDAEVEEGGAPYRRCQAISGGATPYSAAMPYPPATCSASRIQPRPPCRVAYAKSNDTSSDEERANLSLSQDGRSCETSRIAKRQHLKQEKVSSTHRLIECTKVESSNVLVPGGGRGRSQGCPGPPPAEAPSQPPTPSPSAPPPAPPHAARWTEIDILVTPSTQDGSRVKSNEVAYYTN